MKTTEKLQLKAYVTKEVFEKFTKLCEEENRSTSSMLNHIIVSELKKHG